MADLLFFEDGGGGVSRSAFTASSTFSGLKEMPAFTGFSRFIGVIVVITKLHFNDLVTTHNVPKNEFTQDDVESGIKHLNPGMDINRDRIRSVLWILANKTHKIRLIRKGASPV